MQKMFEGSNPRPPTKIWVCPKEVPPVVLVRHSTELSLKSQMVLVVVE